MDCEQLALDGDWTLARTNACHIAIFNDEMGEVRDEMIYMNTNISYLLWCNGIQTAVWVFILVFVGKKALTQMWGKSK